METLEKDWEPIATKVLRRAPTKSLVDTLLNHYKEQGIDINENIDAMATIIANEAHRRAGKHYSAAKIKENAIKQLKDKIKTPEHGTEIQQPPLQAPQGNRKTDETSVVPPDNETEQLEQQMLEAYRNKDFDKFHDLLDQHEHRKKEQDIVQALREGRHSDIREMVGQINKQGVLPQQQPQKQQIDTKETSQEDTQQAIKTIITAAKAASEESDGVIHQEQFKDLVDHVTDGMNEMDKSGIYSKALGAMTNNDVMVKGTPQEYIFKARKGKQQNPTSKEEKAATPNTPATRKQEIPKKEVTNLAEDLINKHPDHKEEIKQQAGEESDSRETNDEELNDLLESYGDDLKEFRGKKSADIYEFLNDEFTDEAMSPESKEEYSKKIWDHLHPEAKDLRNKEPDTPKDSPEETKEQQDEGSIQEALANALGGENTPAEMKEVFGETLKDQLAKNPEVARRLQALKDEKAKAAPQEEFQLEEKQSKRNTDTFEEQPHSTRIWKLASMFSGARDHRKAMRGMTPDEKEQYADEYAEKAGLYHPGEKEFFKLAVQTEGSSEGFNAVGEDVRNAIDELGKMPSQASKPAPNVTPTEPQNKPVQPKIEIRRKQPKAFKTDPEKLKELNEQHTPPAESKSLADQYNEKGNNVNFGTTPKNGIENDEVLHDFYQDNKHELHQLHSLADNKEDFMDITKDIGGHLMDSQLDKLHTHISENPLK